MSREPLSAATLREKSRDRAPRPSNQRAGTHPSARVAPARGRGRRPRERARRHARRLPRGDAGRRIAAAMRRRRRAPARARAEIRAAQQRVVGQGHRGSGLGSGRLPRDETRGGGDATADAPSRSLKTATPGSRDLARGDARDRVRSRSRRATQPSPSLSEFADSHRHTVSLKNASRFFWGSCDWMPIRFFHVGSPVYTTRHSSHDTLFDFFGVSFGVSQS